jgi:Putative prokaryotic signal transducing protein
MIVTRESLTEHFGLLGDDELLDQFRSGDLTELAHDVAGAELTRRKIDPSMKAEAPPPETAPAAAEPPPEDETATNDEDLLLLGRFYNPVDAYLLQSRLDAEGVPAIVADALTYQNMAFGAAVVGGVRVLVPESYLARAAEIKKQIDRGDFALDDKSDVG